jgi:hypothetical protein
LKLWIFGSTVIAFVSVPVKGRITGLSLYIRS